jgi:hypothetical protein
VDAGPLRTLSIEGAVEWDVNVPNGSAIDQLMLATLGLSGSAEPDFREHIDGFCEHYLVWLRTGAGL